MKYSLIVKISHISKSDIQDKSSWFTAYIFGRMTRKQTAFETIVIKLFGLM